MFKYNYEFKVVTHFKNTHNFILMLCLLRQRYKTLQHIFFSVIFVQTANNFFSYKKLKLGEISVYWNLACQ